MTKFPQTSPQNNSEAVESELKMSKDKYVPLEKGQQITDDL